MQKCNGSAFELEDISLKKNMSDIFEYLYQDGLYLWHLERNKVNLHPLDPIFVTNSNPDPNTAVLVCSVLEGFMLELSLTYSDKN